MGGTVGAMRLLSKIYQKMKINMTEKEKIDNEIVELQKFERVIGASSKASKIRAREIKMNLESFLNVHVHHYANASKFFEDDESARIDLDDAIENLNAYIKSKLKQKDDWHYYEALNKISLGFKEVISNLKKNHSNEDE